MVDRDELFAFIAFLESKGAFKKLVVTYEEARQMIDEYEKSIFRPYPGILSTDSTTKKNTAVTD